VAREGGGEKDDGGQSYESGVSLGASVREAGDGRMAWVHGEGGSQADFDAEGSTADETRGHVCGVRKMAGEYSGEEGDGNKVLQGVDAMEEASGGAVPWGLEAIDSGGGAERPDDGEDHKTDAASKPIVCDGPVAAKCAGLEAGASRGGEEARYHAADREANAESGQGIGI
jgi:hypothetical protein